MVIQHNIMALNAYRNYNNNTSALSKNLEKLSSGYKINRAGDDAAGLAISEKMRAQITGLDAASKNVKDGISLVKTAEGAMQEVQDMLNRMVDLATQSANGTYQDAVDREALQAEIDQLNSEIDRIADSANFNGIKLLDGSLDKSAVTGVTYNKTSTDDIVALLPPDMEGTEQKDVNQIGQMGALETDGSTEPSKNSFQVSLDGLSIEVTGESQEFTLEIGDDVKMNVTLEKGKYSGAQLANKLAEKYKADGIVIGDKGQKFDVKTDGNVLKFSNTEKTDAGLNTSAKVTWTLGDAEDPAEEPVAVTQPDSTAATFTDAQAGTSEATITFDLAGFDVDKAGTVTFSIGGKDYDVQITEDEVAAKATTSLDKVAAKKLAAALDASQLQDPAAGAFSVDNFSDGDTAITLKSANQAQATDAGITGITGYTVAAKAADADAANGATGTQALLDAEATDGTPASLTVTVSALGGTPQNNDSITFESDGSTQLNLTFNYDGSEWTLDSGSTAPEGYEATFDGSKLVLTATANKEVANSPFGDVSVTAATIAGNSGSEGSVTLENAAGAWESGTDPVEGPGDGDGNETPTTETVASSELTAASVDFADDSNKLDATGIKQITDLGEVTVGDLKIDLSKISLTAGTDTGKTAADAILKAAKDAADAWNAANPEAEYTYGNIRISTTPDGANDGDIIAQNAGDGIYILADKIPNEAGGDGNTNASGYINTGIQNVTTYDAGSSAQLANAAVNFGSTGANAWQDGSKITIGDTTYTVAVGKDSVFKNVNNVIDLTDQTAGKVDDAVAAKRLTAAAANNSIFTVGHDGKGNTTLQQKSSVKDTTDMTTKEKFASYLGISTPDSIDGAVAGKGLTLQIGDTSDSYNQLTVSIGDIHADALGVGSINVGTQEGAQAAVNVIKNAINQVSSIRGTLGATQNRLEHTANNLSVMAENIQDAESTIRDTDVAEEMMSYVKNNILVQSAQAMLAQANQVPQGVLQLLG